MSGKNAGSCSPPVVTEIFISLIAASTAPLMCVGLYGNELHYCVGIQLWCKVKRQLETEEGFSLPGRDSFVPSPFRTASVSLLG